MTDRTYQDAQGNEYRVAEFDGKLCVFYRFGEAWVLMSVATQRDLEQIGYNQEAAA